MSKTPRQPRKPDQQKRGDKRKNPPSDEESQPETDAAPPNLTPGQLRRRLIKLTKAYEDAEAANTKLNFKLTNAVKQRIAAQNSEKYTLQRLQTASYKEFEAQQRALRDKQLLATDSDSDEVTHVPYVKPTPVVVDLEAENISSVESWPLPSDAESDKHVEPPTIQSQALTPPPSQPTESELLIADRATYSWLLDRRDVPRVGAQSPNPNAPPPYQDRDYPFEDEEPSFADPSQDPYIARLYALRAYNTPTNSQPPTEIELLKGKLRIMEQEVIFARQDLRRWHTATRANLHERGSNQQALEQALLRYENYWASLQKILQDNPVDTKNLRAKYWRARAMALEDAINDEDESRWLTDMLEEEVKKLNPEQPSQPAIQQPSPPAVIPPAVMVPPRSTVPSENVEGLEPHEIFERESLAARQRDEAERARNQRKDFDPTEDFDDSDSPFF